MVGNALAPGRLAGQRRGDRLHALLRDRFHLHRLGRGARLPGGALQHRGRRPGLPRRAWRRSRVPAWRRPAGLAADSPRHRRRGPVRRPLGRHPRRAAGQAGQPHRHHDDHVQLAGLDAHGLSAGQHAARAGLDAGRNRRLCAGRHDPVPAHPAGPGRDRRRGHAAQPVVRARAGLRGRGLGLRLAHPYRLRDPHRGGQSGRRPLRRDFAVQDRDPDHGAVGGAGGRGRGQRDHGGAEPAAARLHLGIWLRRASRWP